MRILSDEQAEDLTKSDTDRGRTKRAIDLAYAGDDLADHDLFKCEGCNVVTDIENSVADADGALHCTVCAAREQAEDLTSSDPTTAAVCEGCEAPCEYDTEMCLCGRCKTDAEYDEVPTKTVGLEFNYYWGDDSFHSSVRMEVSYPTTAAHCLGLCEQHKPKHSSVAYAIVYVDDVYSTTITLN
jgi:hypothetical protein